MSLLSLIIFGAVSVYSFHVLAFLIALGCVNMIIQVYRAKFSCEMDNIFFFALHSFACMISACVILKSEHRKFSITPGGKSVSYWRSYFKPFLLE